VTPPPPLYSNKAPQPQAEDDWGSESKAPIPEVPDTVDRDGGGWGNSQSSPSVSGWGVDNPVEESSTEPSGWGADLVGGGGWGLGAAPIQAMPPPPVAPTPGPDTPWLERTRGDPTGVEWGLPHKNPLEQVLANKVDLWREDNAGYEMLMRMGGTHRLGPKGNADTGALWKNDRKGLGRSPAPSPGPLQPDPAPPPPSPQTPLALKLHTENPATYAALWAKYCTDWRLSSGTK